MKNYKSFLVLLTLFLWVPLYVVARINLPAIFTDHMVLQQKSSVLLWGWAGPTEEITISGSWDNVAVTTTTSNQAAWRITLNTPAAGGPYHIVIRGKNDTLRIEDVLIGEVWLASGQSNMELAAARINNGQQEIAEADYPAIRLFQVAKRTAKSAQVDLEGRWEVCTSSSMKDFSAAAYFFARRLQEELKIPIGVIHSSWGGTGAEVWVNPAVISGNQEFADAAGLILKRQYGPREPGSAFNAMIAPLIPFRLAGAIWYQGETNRSNPFIYERLFTSLIKNWRDEWNHDFPFYYVQIAPFMYKEPEVGVLIREAQLKSLSVPQTGMVVISDIGNVKDIHPGNKQDVGKRLANWALAQTYHLDGIPFSGPIYNKMKIENRIIRIFFDHAEQGLVARGGELTHFQIAGEDGVFVDAKATIDGRTVEVKSRRIKTPKAVRFAWSNSAEPNLFNKEGLPASCFRTDK